MWEGFRRLYQFAMTENMRAILRRCQKQLFTDKIKQEFDINERSVWSAATIVEVDEAYTRYSFLTHLLLILVIPPERPKQSEGRKFGNFT